MAATRLDHPVFISAEQIRRREFVTIRRGYDPDQVRIYLEEVAGQVDLMASMIREARLEADSAIRSVSQPTVDPYERLAARVASVLREADETADRIRVEGQREAERMTIEARTDADRIRTDAQAKAEQARSEAERALHEARDQADRTISGLATRREALVEQLAQMQERLLGVARDLEAAIESPTPEDEGGETEGVEAERIVDVRTSGAPSAGGPGAGDDVLEGLEDPSYEEFWDGTETIQLDVPIIPPLDLAWDTGDEDRNGSS